MPADNSLVCRLAGFAWREPAVVCLGKTQRPVGIGCSKDASTPPPFPILILSNTSLTSHLQICHSTWQHDSHCFGQVVAEQVICRTKKDELLGLTRRNYGWYYCFHCLSIWHKWIYKRHTPQRTGLTYKVCNKGTKCERYTNSHFMVFLKKKSTLKMLRLPLGVTYNHSLQIFKLLRFHLQTPYCKLTSAPGRQAGDLIGTSDCHPSDRANRRPQEAKMLWCACWAQQTSPGDSHLNQVLPSGLHYGVFKNCFREEITCNDTHRKIWISQSVLGSLSSMIICAHYHQTVRIDFFIISLTSMYT